MNLQRDKVGETRLADVMRTTDGLLCIRYRPGAVVTLADAEEEVALVHRLHDGSGAYTLIDSRAVQRVERAARLYYGGDAASREQRAVALLVGSTLSRLIANFFLGFNRPPVRFSVFADEEAALGWLRQRRAQDGA